MLDLFGNHIVGFLMRWLNYDMHLSITKCMWNVGVGKLFVFGFDFIVIDLI